jgi:hypothetical protein
LSVVLQRSWESWWRRPDPTHVLLTLPLKTLSRFWWDFHVPGSSCALLASTGVIKVPFPGGIAVVEKPTDSEFPIVKPSCRLRERPEA